MNGFIKALMFIALASLAYGKSISGTGASFPADVYYAWSASYKKATDIRINYQSIGSGGGIKQVQSGIVDFGASDEALSKEELDKHNLYQFPTIVGAITLSYNLDGIKDAELKLSNEVVALIFLGKITKWDDPKIKALNPNLKLPSATINSVHRSDSSGTTYNFTKWLGTISSQWEKTFGHGKSISWPNGVGAKGNEGVAQVIKQTKNSIGYLELSYKNSLKLKAALLQDALGGYVYPDSKSISLAMQKASFEASNNFDTSLISIKQSGAYPIASTTFILLPKAGKNSKKVKEFFAYSFKNGDNDASSMGFLPLTKELKAKVESYLKF